MIIAMPVMEDNGRDSVISEHFGHNPLFAIYDSENMELEIVSVGEHGMGCTPVGEIMKHGADTVYTLGIGGRAIDSLKENGIVIKTGGFRKVGDVIDNIGKLEELREGCGH
ncbi:MAG: NifB/NifX family molybdenum-iron cluster-binding protein [Candidatus Aenigmarchaeota archaeon]|nr:NifB/NifX family molybdenum-iron cluster-binding protein [Candidatus Aenigmarchaeota archaeon]